MSYSKWRIRLITGFCFLFLSLPLPGLSQSLFNHSHEEWESLSVPLTYVPTGIVDILNFLNRCPTNDPVYSEIRQDFELLSDGEKITYSIPCVEPYSTLPIAQLTDELIALQTLRTAYYMGIGTEGKLPWTSKNLYTWMKSNISGVNFKATPGQFYCCDFINGKKYIGVSRADAIQRDFKRDWKGIAITLDFYAHEIRHSDPGAPGHTTGCREFPLPTDPGGCDATYNLGNLGSYGVQYWLESEWAKGYLNIGIGCAPPNIASDYALWNQNSANNFRNRFVTNVPAIVTAPQPYGGPCLLTNTLFADVPSSYWAYNYIFAIYKQGITQGCSQNPLSYCPSSNVTRGQMAAFIVRSLYGETFAYTQTPYFADVPTTNGFFKYVQKLRDVGITTSLGTYGVDDNVTRGQMAAFIIRAKYGETFSYTSIPYYMDVPADNIYFKYIQKLRDVGITTTTGTYMINDFITRDQMAAFLARGFLGMN
jgi:hypothetical protein